MDPLSIGIVGAVALVLLAVIGVRIAYAAALVGVLGLMILMKDFYPAIVAAGTVPFAKGTSYELSVLPMFILIGYLAYYAGMTTTSFEAAKRWFGWMPGGLAIGTIFAVAAFSAVSGASTAAAAVFSRVAIPEMLKAGYNRRLAAGVVAAGSTLDSLIPPSALLVIYGIIVEQSIGDLLIAGFVPGIISALVYSVIVVVICKANPSLGRPIGGFTWRQRFASLPPTAPIWIVILLIFTSMLLGWATPTEAGALGAFSTLLFAWRHGMNLGQFRGALLESAKLTVMIFTIIWGVLIFVRFLGFANLPLSFAEWIEGLKMHPLLILLAIYAIYLVLGCFMDAIGMMLLTLPIFFPVVEALGYDPIWFGIIVVK
ncbi:MAG: TRAP transporter large permease, partial [Betaproteobacteria bacterium]|nr:TRAP transporter large permease [Betaproteobacteria bacterium]